MKIRVATSLAAAALLVASLASAQDGGQAPGGGQQVQKHTAAPGNGGAWGDAGPGVRGGPGDPGRMGGQVWRGGGFGRHRPGMGPMLGGGRLAEALGLTDGQRDKMREIMERQRRHGIQARADLQIARLDLRDLMRADSPSETAIHAQIDRIAKLRADQEKARVSAMLEMRSQLTPSQLEKLKDLRRHAGAGAGQGHMGPRGLHGTHTGSGPGGPGGDGDGDTVE